MPLFDKTPEAYDRIPITSLRSTHETEQRILNNALENSRNLVQSPAIRLSKAKSVVNYYQAKYLNENDRVKAGSVSNDIDPNTVRYRKIKNLLVEFEERSIEQEESDVSRTLSFSGTAYILPRTIRPDVGDYMEAVLDENVPDVKLFLITNVRSTSQRSENAYEVEYKLEKRNYRPDESPLHKRVYEEFVFKEEHIGTQFRTVFKVDETVVFDKIFNMYKSLSEEYHRLFFDDVRSSFFLNIPEAIKLQDEFSGDQTLGQYPDRLSIRNEWVKTNIYDRELIEFIIRNRIFDYVGQKLSIPMKYYDSTPKTYHRTIFYALERGDYRHFSKGYQEIIQVSSGNTHTDRMLYGFGDVKHVVSLEDGIATLFPPGFIRRLAVLPDTSVDDNIYKYQTHETTDFLIDLINLFLNRKDVKFTTFLDRLDHFEKSNLWMDLYEENIRIEYKFYLYPILGYIFSIALSTIATEEASKEWFN